MPPIVFAILGGIQAAIAAAPKVVAIAKAGKAFIASLTGTLITKEQQDSIHARIDEIAKAHANGKLPDGWAVEPDPQDLY